MPNAYGLYSVLMTLTLVHRVQAIIVLPLSFSVDNGGIRYHFIIRVSPRVVTWCDEHVKQIRFRCWRGTDSCATSSAVATLRPTIGS